MVRTHGSLSVIGAGATVGPYAYLRPGTSSGRAARSAPSWRPRTPRSAPGPRCRTRRYVGDAEIGDGANIGAGVIFANYDGVTKSASTVGRLQLRRQQLGAAAPVTIADGAYVAAGSTITGDVGPGELAVSRGRQRNIPGWVARKRAGTTRPGGPAPAARRAASRRHARKSSRGAAVTGVKKPNDKHLMLFSGRAYPDAGRRDRRADGRGARADPGDLATPTPRSTSASRSPCAAPTRSSSRATRPR